MAKGGQFERDFCRQLSTWWSLGILGEEHDDLFWRTAGSGAMATTRSKQNKKTRGHYSDVTSTDPIGNPLTNMITFELKRGYNKANIGELIYTSERKKKPCTYQEWITKLKKTAQHAGSPWWMLIHKPDFKKPVITVPGEMFILFEENIIGDCLMVQSANWNTTSMMLEDFLRGVEPEEIKRIWEDNYARK